MRLQGTRGISKVIFIISMLVALIVGATLSYVWTMGYYASQEYKLPKNPHITIEDVAFSAQNASFFNVTILNPSYSSSNVEVSQIVVSTNDGVLHNVETSPRLPYLLNVGSSQTFEGIWNWANYTGQTVKVNAYVTETLFSGATAKVEIP